MPSIIQNLIEKGWNEEEINEFLHLSYRDSKVKKEIKNKFKTLNRKTTLLLLLISYAVFGLFFLVFVSFRLEFVSLLLIVLLASFTEVKATLVFEQTKNLLIKSVALTSAIIILFLGGINELYANFISFNNINYLSIEKLLVIFAAGIASAVFTGLLISLTQKEKKPFMGNPPNL